MTDPTPTPDLDALERLRLVAERFTAMQGHPCWYTDGQQHEMEQDYHHASVEYVTILSALGEIARDRDVLDVQLAAAAASIEALQKTLAAAQADLERMWGVAATFEAQREAANEKAAAAQAENARLREALPDAVVAELFSNAFGERAERLAMKDASERDLGGWCSAAVKDRVRKAIDAALAQEER